jgi:hypothetical protein
MLGRLEMTVTDCIKTYMSLSNKVFQKNNSRFKINSKIWGRFDAEE